MMSKPTDIKKISETLIDDLYSATVSPDHLDNFEKSWEAFFDVQETLPAGQEASSSAAIDMVSRHINLADELLDRVSVSSGEYAAQSLVDNQRGPCLLIDKAGQVVKRNKEAQYNLYEADHIGGLPIDTRALQTIKSFVYSDTTLQTSPALYTVCEEEADVRSYCLAVQPVVNRADKTGSIAKYFLLYPIAYKLSNIAIPTLCAAYGLSRTEADIAIRLVNGHNSAQISADRNSSVNTVRNQIKTAQSKIGAKGTPDMVRIICQMIERGPATEQSAGAKLWKIDTRPYERRGEITLRDGRRLAFREYGDPQGRPVMFMGSSFVEVGLSQQAILTCAKQGWRFLCPERPGYGASQPNFGLSVNKRISSFSEDIRELMAHLGVEAANFIGSTTPLHFSVTYPKKSLGMLCVGAVPHWEKEFINQIEPRYRHIIKASIMMPKIVPIIGRLLKAKFEGSEENDVIEGFSRTSSADKAVLENEEYKALIAEGIRYTSLQGMRAQAEDVAPIHTNWSHLSKRITVPVDVMHGNEDMLVPRGFILPFLKLIPHANAHWIEGGGKYLILTHFDKVLEIIEAQIA